LRNLGSTPDVVARRCVLGTKQSTRCGGSAWRKTCKQNNFCVGVVWQTQSIQHRFKWRSQFIVL